MDTSVINEEPNEDEESSVQECRKVQREQKYQPEFVGDEEECEREKEGRAVVTSMSVLETESLNH